MLLTTLITLLAASSIAKPLLSTKKWSDLSISPNGRYLSRLDGTPFFWQADTAWELAARLNASDVDAYLRDRSSKGFNVVQVVAVAELNGTTHPNYYGDLPLESEDPTRPVEAYFQYLDWVVERAADYGILTALVPAWGRWVNCGWRGEPVIFDSANAYAFGRYIGARYPGLPKIVGGDSNGDWACSVPEVREAFAADPAQDPFAMLPMLTDTRNTWAAMVDGLAEAENLAGSDLFVAYHPTNVYLNVSGLPLPYGHNYLNGTHSVSMDAVQSGHAVSTSNEAIVGWNSLQNYDMVREMRDAFSGPVIDLENHYEGAHIAFEQSERLWNSSEVRHGLWNGFFSGSAGVTYGAHSVWQLYDPLSLLDSGRSYIEPQNNLDSNASWRFDLQLEGAGQVQYLKKLFEELEKDDYFALTPDTSFIESVGDDVLSYQDNRHVGGLSSGEMYWVYTGYGDTFKLGLSSRAGSVTVQWYNPRVGSYSEERKYDTASLTMQSFTPPTSGTVDDDWVLCARILN